MKPGTRTLLCAATALSVALGVHLVALRADDATDWANQQAQAQKDRDDWQKMQQEREDWLNQQAQAQKEREDWQNQQAQAQKDRDDWQKMQQDREDWLKQQAQAQKDREDWEKTLKQWRDDQQQRNDYLNSLWNARSTAPAAAPAAVRPTVVGPVILNHVATPVVGPVGVLPRPDEAG